MGKKGSKRKKDKREAQKINWSKTDGVCPVCQSDRGRSFKDSIIIMGHTFVVWQCDECTAEYREAVT